MPHSSSSVQDREEIRYAVRRYLAARPTAAMTMDVIAASLRARGLPVSQTDVEQALAFWMDTEPAQVKSIRPDPHSVTCGYQITTAGVLAEERMQ